MTLFVYVGGVDVSSRIRLEDGIQTMTSAADGSFGDSVLVLDDPTGTDTYTQWSQVIVNETASTPPRCFTGYVHKATVERGPFKVGAGRIWTLEVGDLNLLLRMTILRAGTSNRPLESGNARLAWLLGSAAMTGIVYDSGLVGANPWMFDETNYVKSYANDVLPDLCVSSSGTVGRIFFVYWDHATARPSLFIDTPTTAVNNSTLSLSNVLTDVNNTTVFSAYLTPAEERDGEDIYCGVLFGWKGGYTYHHRQTTHDAYFTVHREALFETDRIGNAGTADAHAEQFLDSHAGQIDTITCVVRLPASKVNLIEAGQRIQVRFNHLPGFSTMAWTRVSRRTFVLTPGTNEYYDVQLELSTRGLTAIGGGNPGNFPHQPVTPSIVQQISGTATITMPSAITAGNTLVVSIVGLIHPGAGSFDYTALGYTLGPLAVAGGPMGTLYKIAGASESTTLSMGANNRGTWYEIPGTWVPGTSDENSMVTDTGNGIVLDAGPITVPASSIVFAVGKIGSGGAFNSVQNTLTFTPGSGMIEDLDARLTPNIWTGHAFPSAGSFTAETTNSANVPVPDTPGNLYAADVPWTMHAVDFTGSTTTTAPTAGQWVEETITMAGASGTTTYLFVAGSLTVKVDLLDQTAAITAQNGAAGTFTLGFTPKTGEVVTVRYQGR